MLPRTLCFELQGESLKAAAALQAELARALDKDPPLDTGSMVEIQQSWKDFQRRFLSRLTRDHPQLLEKIGFNHPVVHLRQDAGCYPRAYRRYPQIFVSQTPPGAIMFVPVGHKDDYFVPQDAGLLEGEARESACNRLFAGGWGGNAPLLSKREEGIPLPAGFASDEGLSQAFTAACDSRHEVAILARGESLARILRHEEALRDYNRKADAVIEALRLEVEKLYPVLAPRYGAREGFFINTTISSVIPDGDETPLYFSLRRDGNGIANPLVAGAPVDEIPPSPAFTLGAPLSAGLKDYNVRTRSDTPEGRAFKQLLDALPKRRPTLDTAEALKVFGTVPDIQVFGPHRILRYVTREGGVPAVLPQDSVLLPVAVLRWLVQDENDIKTGIKPPPIPAAVERSLRAALSCDSPAWPSTGASKRP